MSIEDRHWYREDFKRRQAIETRPQSKASHQPVPQRLLVRYDSPQLPNLGTGSVLIFALFLLAVFAAGSFFV